MDHTGPSAGHGRQGEVFYSGFGFFAVGIPEDVPAAPRERFGDEMANDLQRERELMRYPRTLTEREREVMRNDMAPVLRDLEASGAIVPEVRYEAHYGTGRDGREGVHAWLTTGGIEGTDVWTPAEETSVAERVCWLADQLQEWQVEELWRAGRAATWPECPEHPSSHPLQPDLEGEDSAVWRCPRSGRVICQIGALSHHG